jgi:hypothetical protein
MVFCIVGFAMFGIIGIFSAKYRRYFRESLHCIRRQMVLKACDTQFDQEMKAKISANASKASPAFGKFILRRFALLSWILLIIMLAGTAAVVLGVYNYIAYGNCNGQASQESCVLNVIGNISNQTHCDNQTTGKDLSIRSQWNSSYEVGT